MANRNDIQEKLIKRAWEDAEFKKELLANPKAAIEKVLQIQIPDSIEVQFFEETPDKMCFVLPVDPASVTSEKLDSNGDFEPQSMYP